MTRQRTIVFALAAMAMLVATSSFAAELKIGDAAPDWSGIPGVDGKKHSLADYKQAKFVVLAFMCNHCPVARDYEERLIALQKEYKSKGVQVIAACVNDLDEDRLPGMKERAAGKDLGRWRTNKEPFNFPYVYDETQKIGRDYAATATPHVFVLDGKRKIAYAGAVDDNQNLKRVKEHFLSDALDALLAGKQPPKTVTKEFGCSIKWKEKEK
jgi:thiol-disulfide isomerase/thioredoxin